MIDVNLTLAVRRSTRYPYTTTRIVGPRSRVQQGELEVLLRLQIDPALLDQRTRRIDVAVQPPKATVATAEAAP